MSLLEPFFYIIKVIIDTYMIFVVLQVVLQWLVHFKILQTSTIVTRKVMDFFNLITFPVYKKISEKIPTKMGGFDFSPFVLILALTFLSRLLYRITVLLVM